MYHTNRSLNRPFAFVLALALAMSLPAASSAADPVGDLVVHVENVDAHEPQAFADVIVLGDRTFRGVSGADGDARFAALPEGRYRVRAFSKGLPEIELRDVIVSANEEARVRVDLSRSGPRTIGHVQARYRTRLSLGQLTDGDARATAAGEPSDALSRLPAVSVDPTGGLGLAGHSASQTMLSLNGVPLGPPGRASNAALLRNGLFSGFTLGTGGYGALGGEIRAETPDPTLRWLTQLAAREDGNGGNGYTTSIRGTTGFVGVSYGHAVSTFYGPLQAQTFADSSGTSYAHQDATTVAGDALKLRIPLRSQLIDIVGVSLNSTAATACNLFVSVQPCGYGRGSTAGDRFRSLQLSDQAKLGAVTAWVSGYRTWNDAQSRGGVLAAGSPFSVASPESRSESAGSSVTAAFPGRHATWFASVNDYHWRATASTPSAYVDAYDWSQAWLRYDDRISDRTTLRATALRTRINGQQRVGAVASVDTRIAANSFSLSYEVGGTGGAIGANPYIDPPQNLTFACTSGELLGSGPTDQTALANRSGVTASWRNKGRRLETLVQAYARTERDAPVGGYVGLAVVDPLIDRPYLQNAAIIARRAGCSSSFAPQDAFLYVNGTVPRVEYRGLYGVMRFDLTRTAYIQPFVALQSAVPYGSSRFFGVPGSTIQQGTQLPGVPRVKAGVLADLPLSPGREFVAAWQYAGANNALRSQPYGGLDLALKVALRNGGSVTAFAQNLLTPRADRFAVVNSSAIAVDGSRGFNPLLYPLPQRTFGIRFDLRARRSPGGPAVADSASVTLAPVPLPATAPSAADAFGIQRSAPACGPEDVQGAQKLLADIQDYSAEVTRLRAAGTDQLPPDRQKDGMQMTYRVGPNGNDAIGVAFTTDAQRAGIGFLRCALLHGGGIADLRQTGAYVPSREEIAEKQLLVWYTNRIGLYVATEETPSESTTISVAALPAKPPADPFALNDTPACPSSVRGAAVALLADLRTTVGSWDPQAATVHAAGPWQAVNHGQASNAWLELHLPGDQMLASVLLCGTIHAGTLAEVRARGLDAAPSARLNFARQLGIYTIDPGTAK
ncbi:MAG TPA: carboxypeptidase-like regulatory domain-containing protein [Candidatus Elarobacter sp.]|jgi:hypothetical protein